jgi:hypothetical protein
MLWVLERGGRRAMKNIHSARQRVEIYQGGERSKLGRHNRQRRQKEGGRSWGGLMTLHRIVVMTLNMMVAVSFWELLI